jgi:hypothetical protein
MPHAYNDHTHKSVNFHRIQRAHSHSRNVLARLIDSALSLLAFGR